MWIEKNGVSEKTSEIILERMDMLVGNNNSSFVKLTAELNKEVARTETIEEKIVLSMMEEIEELVLA